MCQPINKTTVNRTAKGYAVFNVSGQRLSKWYATNSKAVKRANDIDLYANSKADPTQTAGNRKRVIDWMWRQAKGALGDIKKYADSVPRERISVKDAPSNTVVQNNTVDVKKPADVTAVNKSTAVYTYDLNGYDPYLTIDEIINKWFGTDSATPAREWFFGLEVDQVNRRGTVTEAERINTLAEMADLGPQYQVQQLLLSDPYRERIRRVRQRVFEEMKGFTGDAANDLARALSNEMAAGSGINEVKRKIAQRFNIKMSRAETIARTELGKSHRDTRRDMTKDSRDRLKLDTFEQWISAMSPTSRTSHMKRNLEFYTPEENEAFYLSPNSQGGYINCLCTQQTVIRTKNGTILGARKK